MITISGYYHCVCESPTLSAVPFLKPVVLGFLVYDIQNNHPIGLHTMPEALSADGPGFVPQQYKTDEWKQ